MKNKSQKDTIDVFLMKEFSILLDSNPSTGYSWIPLFDEKFIELKNHSFKTNSKRLGSGGTESFKFNPIKHGTTILTMNYKRSWENHQLKEIKFEIRIH